MVYIYRFNQLLLGDSRMKNILIDVTFGHFLKKSALTDRKIRSVRTGSTPKIDSMP